MNQIAQVDNLFEWNKELISVTQALTVFVGIPFFLYSL